MMKNLLILVILKIMKKSTLNWVLLVLLFITVVLLINSNYQPPLNDDTVIKYLINNRLSTKVTQSDPQRNVVMYSLRKDDITYIVFISNSGFISIHNHSFDSLKFQTYRNIKTRINYDSRKPIN